MSIFCNRVSTRVIIVLLVLTGCQPAVYTTRMAIDVSRYDPAVSRFPASVGVYFPADFFDNNFYHETDDDYHQVFHNNPADATRKALDVAFKETFAEVRYLDTLQQGSTEEDLAFVVVPNIDSMPSRLDAEVIAVGVIYQFEFYAEGKHIATWQVTGLDYLKRSSGQKRQASGGVIGQAYSPGKISPEKFDAVARGAVWDAVSVLLARFGQQSIVSGRLPSPMVMQKTKMGASPPVGESKLLALVGPVYDQDQELAQKNLEGCLIEGIQDQGASLKTIAQRDLRERLYPWLSRSNYPNGPPALQSIIKEPAVRQRLTELGVDYVLNWDGATTSSQFSGPFYTTFYGTIGYQSSDKTSKIKADLLAVADGRLMSSFESAKEGKEAVLGLVWVSIPVLTDTEGDACVEITREIDAYFQSTQTANQKNAGILVHR